MDSPVEVTRRQVLWGAGLLAVGVVVGLAAGTQALAAALRYARPLGDPWGHVGGVPVYAPWSLLLWRSRFGAAAPHAVDMAQVVAGFVVAVVVAVPAAVAIRLRRGAGYADAHGTAGWAADRDLKARGLLEDSGVVLCQTADATVEAVARGGLRQRRAGRLVRDASGLHVLVYAPSGSGKTVAICIPTLLSWTSSVLVWDTKRELWQQTAGWRSTFSRCIRYEPTAPDSDRYNPLAEIRKGTANEIRDTEAIAEMLADPDGKGDEGGGNDNARHFRESAQTLLKIALLHTLYAEENKSLPGVHALLADPERDKVKVLERMGSTLHLGDRVHPVVARGVRSMLNRSATELSGVFSTADVALGPYSSDPLLGRAVSGHDFRIRDLMHGGVPTSLYLVVPPSDLSRLRPLMRILLNQIVRRLTEENTGGGGEAPRHRLLCLLDEFPTLGRMPVISDGIAYFRAFSIKLLLITQSVKQLAERYGEKNSIVDNCDLRLTYHANDPETGKYVSETLGTRTYVTRRESVSQERGGVMGKEQTSTSSQEHARALMTPDEVQRLPRNEAILFGGGGHPYRGKKVVWFDDKRFKARAAVPPPTPGEVTPRTARAEGSRS